LKKNEEKIYLSAYGRKDIPKGLIEDGEIKDVEEVASLIKKTLADSKPNPIKSKFVVYSIPEPKGFIRVVDIPDTEESETEEAIRYEAEQLFPIDIGESYLDWQILSRNSDALKILVAAVPKQLVDSYSSVLRSAGLVPVAAEIESIAITRSLINKEQSSRPILIIDLGKDRTSFIIFKNPAVQFTASIPICGKEFNKAISKEFGVDEEKAERIKEKCGLSLKSECRKVYRAIQPSLHEMIKYIDKLTDYYRGHYKSESDIAKVIICGGEARIIGISSFLSLRIKKEIERANPWINITSSVKKETLLISRNDSLVFVTVLGLAMRGVEGF
jgi:type IV pilus assembly protein PilM